MPIDPGNGGLSFVNFSVYRGTLPDIVLGLKGALHAF